METYRVEVTVLNNGTLTIEGLPLQKGEKVEVVVHRYTGGAQGRQRYALRGKPVRYIDPLRSVAESDWETLP